MVRVGERKKVYTLSYADDMVLVAENEVEMRSMIEKLKGYLKRRGLELSENKSKMLRFRRGGGRWRK